LTWLNTVKRLTAASMLPIRAFRYVASVDLDAVIESLAPRLVAYALGRTGCPGLAEDIAQESLMALIQRWRQAGPPDSPEAYVFAIAKRRAGRANARRSLFAPLESVLGVASRTIGVDSAYEQRSELDHVLTAVRKLSRTDREVLLLSAAGELTSREIATVTGITAAAVKMRLHRGRQRLEVLLAESNHGPRKSTA
jgi:RNA polymerase sigma-70 factor (ECF subfamily)